MGNIMDAMAALADDWRNRIKIDPEVCHGKACIAGTRVIVDVVVSYLANGDMIEQVLESFPSISLEDVYAALHYAALMTRWREVPLES